MNDFEKITRRDFTLKSALLVLTSVPITIAACGDSSTQPSPTPSAAPAPTPQDAQGAVGTNHGHTASITAAELAAGGALSLDITGTSNHPHSVDLSMAEVGQIAQGMRVQKTSSNNAGHTHTVTFN